MILITLQFVASYYIFRYFTFLAITLFVQGHIGLISCCMIANIVFMYFFYVGCLWNIEMVRPLFPKGDI